MKPHSHLSLSMTLPLLFFCIFNAGCKKDSDCTDVTNPDCPSYDYCQAVKDISADFETFIFSESAPFGDAEVYKLSMVIRDTTFGGLLFFRALDESVDTYEWSFGDDPRTNYGVETSIQLNPSTTSGNIDINLNVFRENGKCTGKDSESIAKTKSFYIIGDDPDFDTRPLLGTFTGNNESESDLPEFSITFFEDLELSEIRLKGFPRNAVNGERLNNPIINYNYKEFLLMPTANKCCSRANGVGQLSDDKQSLRIEYEIYDFDTEKWVEKVWLGTR